MFILQHQSILFRTRMARNCIHHAHRDGKDDKSRYSEYSEREVVADAHSSCNERKGEHSDLR